MRAWVTSVVALLSVLGVAANRKTCLHDAIVSGQADAYGYCQINSDFEDMETKVDNIESRVSRLEMTSSNVFLALVQAEDWDTTTDAVFHSSSSTIKKVYDDFENFLKYTFGQPEKPVAVECRVGDYVKGLGTYPADDGYSLMACFHLGRAYLPEGRPAHLHVSYKYTTDWPSSSPTVQPSTTPTTSPTSVPTTSPSMSPTEPPTESPTDSPTKSPTGPPTQSPTEPPTQSPTESPTQSPTESPTQSPTKSPTQSPTKSPTQSPTKSPTQSPTESPTQAPTQSKEFNAKLGDTTWHFLLETTDKTTGSYIDIMKETCGKHGMKPICEYSGWCDDGGADLGQTSYIIGGNFWQYDQHFPEGWAAIAEKFAGYCYYSTENPGNANPGPTARCPSPHANDGYVKWRYSPVLNEQSFYCARILDFNAKLGDTTWHFLLETTDKTTGSYIDIMLETCGKHGMKPICEHPVWCDDRGANLGQTYHIIQSDQWKYDQWFPEGWAAIGQNFAWTGYCYYAKTGNAACRVPSVPGISTWRSSPTLTERWFYCAGNSPPLVSGR